MNKEFNSYPELERLYSENCFENDKRRLKFFDSVIERNRRLIKILNKEKWKHKE